MSLDDDAKKIQLHFQQSGKVIPIEQINKELELFAQYQIFGSEAERGIIHKLGDRHPKRLRPKWKSKEAERKFLEIERSHELFEQGLCPNCYEKWGECERPIDDLQTEINVRCSGCGNVLLQSISR